MLVFIPCDIIIHKARQSALSSDGTMAETAKSLKKYPNYVMQQRKFEIWILNLKSQYIFCLQICTCKKTIFLTTGSCKGSISA